MPIAPINILPENSLSITRGTSKTIELIVTDCAGKAANLTGAKVVLTVKDTSSAQTPLIQKNSDFPAQAEITFPRLGKARFYMFPADTQTLALKQYTFDVWVILASGERYAVVAPTIFEVLAGVTLLAL